MDQPVASTNKGPQQKSLQYDTTGKVANNSDSDAYKNADISEGDDICETEESDPQYPKESESAVILRKLYCKHNRTCIGRESIEQNLNK
jgi:hypothetical protein